MEINHLTIQHLVNDFIQKVLKVVQEKVDDFDIEEKIASVIIHDLSSTFGIEGMKG